MRGVRKKIRRNACVILLALIFAYVFFEVGMLYQEKQNEKRQEQERNKGSMKTHRKESVRDISKKRDKVLKSLNDKLKDVTERKSNDAMILIGKLTSSPQKKTAEGRSGEKEPWITMFRKKHHRNDKITKCYDSSLLVIFSDKTKQYLFCLL